MATTKDTDKMAGIGKIYYFVTSVNANLLMKLLHAFPGDGEVYLEVNQCTNQGANTMGYISQQLMICYGDLR